MVGLQLTGLAKFVGDNMFKYIFIFILFIFVTIACSQQIVIVPNSFTSPTIYRSETAIPESNEYHKQQQNQQPIEVQASQLVDIESINKKIILDIKYATKNNFLKQKLYPESRCILRYSTAKKLVQVQENLKQKKLGLKVYDCYRPISVQKKMWQVLPDDKYVANPARGSRHNRGAAVDITLVDSKGQKLEMPSQFDEFSVKSHRNYKGGSLTSRKNRQLLEDAMKKQGFIGLATEWWHFDAPEWESYPITDIPFEKIPTS
ncbi:peptidase M15D vanX D-ala-D-ala dipeptidase [Calothrix sp. NIES-4101]|nr:peptidase M15D vanX D-ala-D-ala dipeptidase [Calothrix sp. NIES-4101]